MERNFTYEELEKRYKNVDARLGLAQEWIQELEADVERLEWLLGFEKDSQSKITAKLIEEIDSIYLDDDLHEDDKPGYIWDVIKSRYVDMESIADDSEGE